MQFNLVASAVVGKSAFVGKMPTSKAELRELCAAAKSAYTMDGGVVHVCRPAVARGSEFSRNQRPRLR